MRAAAFNFGLLATTMPVVIASTGEATAASRFSFEDPPSLSVMSPPPKSTEEKAPESAPSFSFGAGCHLGINHTLLIWNHNVPTT